MLFRLLAISFLFLTSCAPNLAMGSRHQGIAPSEEVKQPVPDYWNEENSDMNFVDPRTCDGSFTPPSVVGGLIKLQESIEFPDDGNRYSQRITAAFFILEDGTADKIWFPYHTSSIATDAVKDAIQVSKFKQATCNGKAGLTRFMITVWAQN